MSQFDVEILAFGAHPDDIEFGCGGILARAAAQGQRIALCDLTLGDKGSHGTPEIRRAEALEAAEILGAERIFLNFSDCEVTDDPPSRLELVRVIRQVRPRLLLAPLWEGTGSHPDHYACGKLTRAAARLARFPKILPDLPPHTVQGVLHYLMPWERESDFLVDITPHLDTYQRLIRCHASQLQTNPYLDWCLGAAGSWGRLLGVDSAQSLVKGNPLVIDDLMQIAQGVREL